MKKWIDNNGQWLLPIGLGTWFVLAALWGWYASCNPYTR